MSEESGVSFEFTSNRVIVQQRQEQALRRALDRIAIRWQAAARLAAPVDTGRLRASIAFSTPNVPGLFSTTEPVQQGLTAVVGSNVEYALAVHEGLPQGHPIRRNGKVHPMPNGRDPNKFIETPGRQLASTFENMITDELRKAAGGTATQGRLFP